MWAALYRIQSIMYLPLSLSAARKAGHQLEYCVFRIPYSVFRIPLFLSIRALLPNKKEHGLTEITDQIKSKV